MRLSSYAFSSVSRISSLFVSLDLATLALPLIDALLGPLRIQNCCSKSLRSAPLPISLWDTTATAQRLLCTNSPSSVRRYETPAPHLAVTGDRTARLLARSQKHPDRRGSQSCRLQDQPRQKSALPQCSCPRAPK